MRTFAILINLVLVSITCLYVSYSNPGASPKILFVIMATSSAWISFLFLSILSIKRPQSRIAYIFFASGTASLSLLSAALWSQSSFSPVTFLIFGSLAAFIIQPFLAICLFGLYSLIEKHHLSRI